MKEERNEAPLGDPEQDRRRQGVKAYLKESFLNAADARPLRPG